MVSRNTKLAPQAALCVYFIENFAGSPPTPCKIDTLRHKSIIKLQGGHQHNEQLRFVHANLKHELYKTMLLGIQDQLLLTDCHTIWLSPAAGITLAS